VLLQRGVVEAPAAAVAAAAAARAGGEMQLTVEVTVPLTPPFGGSYGYPYVSQPSTSSNVNLGLAGRTQRPIKTAGGNSYGGGGCGGVGGGREGLALVSRLLAAAVAAQSTEKGRNVGSFYSFIRTKVFAC
jgi:hypothetical protein